MVVMRIAQRFTRYKIPSCYRAVFCICALSVLLALVLDTPAHIARNYYKIITSRSVLVTDYVALAGISAALFNMAVSGFFYLLLLIKNKIEPNGKIMAALFVAMGFSLFGKNILNTLPILIGVWLHAKYNKVKFSDLFVCAMFSATIAPLVSEIAFLNEWASPLKFIAACGVGLFVGFIFPVVTEAAKRMHRGYCLYNSGVAGGFIATLSAGLLRSAGIEVLPGNFWDTSHTPILAALVYCVAASLILYGVVADKPLNACKKLRSLLNEKSVGENDYLVKYGNTCYINIGVMCIVATSTMLFLKMPINGPVLGGIFTVAGFAAAGKHMKNTIPILLGSVVAAHLNRFELTCPSNALAILFSTGLAPVVGKYGWRWGIVIGFSHVSVAIFIGQLNGGLNLYNNGFAESFVTITIVPLIAFFNELRFNKKTVRC